MKTALITIIGSYLSIVVLVYIFQRSLMYAPGHDVLMPHQADVPEMTVHVLNTSDGLAITSWFAAPKSPEMPVVIIFHGNAGTLSGRAFKARYFLDEGMGVMLVGYRGYSDNPGTPDEMGLYEDARSALGFLAKQGILPDQMILYGESLGCAIAVQMAYEAQQNNAAEQSSLSGIILESPFTSMGDAASHHYPWLPARLLVKDRYDSSSKMPSLKTPVLIIHGEKDPTIPQSQGKALFELASEPKEALWINGAGHNNLYDYNINQSMVAWIFKSRTNPPL
jgi:uncharacterized protein